MITKTVENSATDYTGEYLTFVLGKEEYCLDILKVQEIRGYDAMTQIANTPEYIKGVINLRDRIVPVIDLRIKLNLDNISYNELTVVIILNLNGLVVGAVVDGVSDVIVVTKDQVREVPPIFTSVDTKYILGIATIAERMLFMIDIQQLITSKDSKVFEMLASEITS